MGETKDEPAGSAEAPEESPATAIIEGAATGGMVGPIGLVGGIVAGWLISRIARRRSSGTG